MCCDPAITDPSPRPRVPILGFAVALVVLCVLEFILVRLITEAS